MKRIGKMKRFCAMLLATVITFSGAGFNAGNAYATELDPSVVEAVDIEAAETEVVLDSAEEIVIDESIVQDEVIEEVTEEEAVAEESDVNSEEQVVIEEETLEIAEETISDEAAMENSTETVKFFKVQKAGTGVSAECENWDEVLTWFGKETEPFEGEYIVTVNNNDSEIYFSEQYYRNGVIGELPDVNNLTIKIAEGSETPINVATGYLVLKGNLTVEGLIFSADVTKDIVVGVKYDLNGHDLTIKEKEKVSFVDIEAIVDNSAGDTRGNVTFEKTGEYFNDITIKRIDNIGVLSIPANMTVINTDSIIAKGMNLEGYYIAAMCDKGEKGFVDTVECVDNCGVFYFKDYDGKMSAKYDFTVNKFEGDVRVDRYNESDGLGYIHYYPYEGGFPRGYKLFNYIPEVNEDGDEIHPIGYAGRHCKDSAETYIARGFESFEYSNGAVYAKSTARVLAKADWLDGGQWDLFYYYDEEDGIDEIEQEGCAYIGVSTNPADDVSARTFQLYPIGGNGVAIYTLSDTNAATLKVDKIKNETTGIIESVATVVVNKNVNWDFEIKVQIDGITRIINVICGQELFEGLDTFWVVGKDHRVDSEEESTVFYPYYSAGTLSYEFYLEKAGDSYRPYNIEYRNEYVSDEMGYMEVPYKHYFDADYNDVKETYPIDLVGFSGNIIFLDNPDNFIVPAYSCFYADSEDTPVSECETNGRLVDCQMITAGEEIDGEVLQHYIGVRLVPKMGAEQKKLNISAENGYCDKERVYIQYRFGKIEDGVIVDSIGPEIINDYGNQYYLIKGIKCTDEDFNEKMKDYSESGCSETKLEWELVPARLIDSTFKWNTPVDITYKFGWEGKNDQVQSYEKAVFFNADNYDMASVAAYAIVNKAPKNALKLSDVTIKNDGWVYDKDSEGKEDTSKPLGRWIWVNADSTVITAYQEAQIQTFQAYFEPVANGPLAELGRVYSTLPVAVTQVKGFDMQGSSNVPILFENSRKEDMRFSIYPNIIGYMDIRDDNFIDAMNEVFQVTWSDKSGGKLVIEDVAEDVLEDVEHFGKTYGANYCKCIYLPSSKLETTADFATTITADITSANGANKLQSSMNVQYVKQFVGDINIKPVEDYAAVGANQKIAEEQWIASTWDGTEFIAYYELKLDWADIKAKQSDVFAVEAVNPWSDSPGSLFDTTKFTWSSSDKTVVSVSNLKTDKVAHKALLTVKKPGNVVVTVKSTDKNASTRKLLVNVVDHTPQFDSKVFTFNKYTGENADQYVSTIAGDNVSKIAFAEGTPDIIKDNLDFMISEYGKVSLVLKGNNNQEQKTAMDALKKGTFDKLKLDVTVNAKDYTIDGIKIVVTDTKPTVKMSAKGKVNLFYASVESDWDDIGADGAVIYALDSEYSINNTGITYKVDTKTPIKSIRIESPALKDTYDIATVYDLTSPTVDSYTGNPGYTFYYKDNEITILPVGLTKETVSLFTDKNNAVAKVKVVICFDDADSVYADASAYKADIVVPVENKKAKLTFVTDDAVAGQHNLEAYIWDAGKKMEVNSFIREEVKIDIPEKNNGIVVEQIYDYFKNEDWEKFFLHYFIVTDTNKANKTVSYKATVDSQLYTTVADVTGKYVYAKQPTLVMGNSNAYINLSTNTAYNGYVEVPMKLKNGNNGVVSRISYGVDAKNKFLIDDNILDVKLFHQYVEGYGDYTPVIAVGIKKGADISKLKDGTKIKLTVKALVDQPMRCTAPEIPEDDSCAAGWDWEFNTVTSTVANLNLTFTNKKEEVSFKAKNQLNVVNRGEELRLVPTLKNTSAKIERVELTGENAKSMFYGYFDNFSNELCIFLNYSANVSLKKTYDLGAIIYLSDGRKIVLDGVSKNQKISIKPVQKMPKINTVVTGVLSLSDPDSRVNINMQLDGADVTGAYISDFSTDFGKVVNESECMRVYYNWEEFSFGLDDTMYTRLGKTAIKPGVYTLKISYRVSGQADNTPSQTTTVKYVVRK